MKISIIFKYSKLRLPEVKVRPETELVFKILGNNPTVGATGTLAGEFFLVFAENFRDFFGFNRD